MTSVFGWLATVAHFYINFHKFINYLKQKVQMMLVQLLYQFKQQDMFFILFMDS